MKRNQSQSLYRQSEIADMTARVLARSADRTPCSCGGRATICDAGPPVRWLCAACASGELEEARAAARSH